MAKIQNWQKTGKPDLSWRDQTIGKGYGLLSVIKNGRSGLSRIELGIPWTTEEFTDLARQCEHPFDKEIRVPPAVAKAMSTIARAGPSGLKKKREETIAYWKVRTAELEKQEKELKERLDPEVARVVKPKAILLFAEMLKSIRYDDMAVVDLLTTGIKANKLKLTPKA